MADLAGNKIQIKDGNGSNLFPRTRAQLVVASTTDVAVFNTDDKLKLDYMSAVDANHIQSNAVTEAKIYTGAVTSTKIADGAVTNAKLQGIIGAEHLPSYVDDVIEVKYIGSGVDCPTYANASHSMAYFYKVSSNANGNKGLYYGNGTKWVSATAIANSKWTSGNTWQQGTIYVDVNGDTPEAVYRWTGTAPVKIIDAVASTTTVANPGDDSLIPTEKAVRTAITGGITSAYNMTSTAFSAASMTGSTVTLTRLNGGTATFDVSSAKWAGNAISTFTKPTGANKSITFTRYDGTTGTLSYVDTNTTDHSHNSAATNGVQLSANGTVWYARADLANGAGAAAGTVMTSEVAVELNPDTTFGLKTATSAKAGTSTYIVPTMATLSKVTSALTSRINKAVADKDIGVAWLGGAGIAKVYTSGTTTTANTGSLVVSVTSAYADSAGNAISTFTKPSGANKSITFTRYDGTTGTLSYVDTNTTDHSHNSAATNGVQLSANGTVWYAKASLADGGGANKGTIATSEITKSVDTATLYGLNTATSAKAGTSTYIVPTMGTLSMVTSALRTTLVRSVTSTTAGLTITPTSGDVTIGGVAFTGASTSTNGSIGMVPAPTSAQAGLFLKANGTWATPANTTDHGHDATGANGVNLSKTGTTWRAVASLANGGGVNAGTVVTSEVAVELNTATMFGLTTATSAKAGTSTYIVPTMATLSKVTSALTSRINKNGYAISTFTKPSGANREITFTRYDGTTGTLSYVDTNTTDHSHNSLTSNGVQLSANGTVWYAKANLADGGGANAGTVLTSEVAVELNPTTTFGLTTATSGKAGTSKYIVPTMATLSKVTSALTSRINKNGYAISTFTKPSGANRAITFTRYDGTTGTLSYVDTNTTYTAATVDEALAGTDTVKYVTPSAYNGTRMENFAVANTSSAGITATTSQQYVPTVHAILDQCLFYQVL